MQSRISDYIKIINTYLNWFYDHVENCQTNDKIIKN